jgi:hypothetical protein
MTATTVMAETATARAMATAMVTMPLLLPTVTMLMTTTAAFQGLC